MASTATSIGPVGYFILFLIAACEMISTEYGDVVIPKQFDLEIDAPMNVTFKILDCDDLERSSLMVFFTDRNGLREATYSSWSSSPTS